jgi:hypothetical protein
LKIILNPLADSVSLKENVLQRLGEFTMLQLTTESGENYGTTQTIGKRILTKLSKMESE